MAEWREHFSRHAPQLDICGSDDVHAKDAEYALVWAPKTGILARLPALKLIISAAAGVDHILADTLRPAHVPIVRMVPEETTITMAEYVLTAAMLILRDIKPVMQAQARHQWLPYPAVRSIAETRVGIMGMGHMGSATARLLARTGFRVAGWSNRHCDIVDVQSYAGADQLAPFLAATNLLVCLLPVTQATRGILNAHTLAQLPAGASLINVGRGAHLIDADLFAALDSGHLHRAVLDVFDKEPLDAASALWDHPAIVITPHCASTPTRADRARHAAMLISRHQQGDALPDIYDPVRGY